MTPTASGLGRPPRGKGGRRPSPPTLETLLAEVAAEGRQMARNLGDVRGKLPSVAGRRHTLSLRWHVCDDILYGITVCEGMSGEVNKQNECCPFETYSYVLPM